MHRTSWTSRSCKVSDDWCERGKFLLAEPKKCWQTLPISNFIVTRIWILQVVRGSCATTSAPATRCTSLWPKRLMRRS